MKIDRKALEIAQFWDMCICLACFCLVSPEEMEEEECPECGGKPVIPAESAIKLLDAMEEE